MNDIRRVMEMVAMLHKWGYGRLRLAPAISPSGMHWRGNVSSTQNILKSHGAMLQHFQPDLVASYSTGQGQQIFGWNDSDTDTPEELARKFIVRFPAIAASGQGEDSAYVAWYEAMLIATEPDGYVYAFADWDVPNDRMPVAGVSDTVMIPLPPPGEAKNMT